MRPNTTLPYRICSAEALQLGPWTRHLAREANEIGSELEGWDYQASLKLSCAYEVSTARVREESNLPWHSVLELAVIASSTAARFRECITRSAKFSLDDHVVSGTLECEIDSALLANSLTLETELLLIENPEPELFTAYLPGSRLLSEHFTVQLEGDAGRFPITTCDFAKELPLLRSPLARWYLWWASTDFDTPINQGLMLYLNEKRPAVIQGLNAEEPHFVEAVSADITRQLLDGALDDEAFRPEPDTYPDNTIGRTLCALYSLCFSDRDIADVRTMRTERPSDYAVLIQNGVASSDA